MAAGAEILVEAAAVLEISVGDVDVIFDGVEGVVAIEVGVAGLRLREVLRRHYKYFWSTGEIHSTGFWPISLRKLIFWLFT